MLLYAYTFQQALYSYSTACVRILIIVIMITVSVGDLAPKCYLAIENAIPVVCLFKYQNFPSFSDGVTQHIAETWLP